MPVARRRVRLCERQKVKKSSFPSTSSNYPNYRATTCDDIFNARRREVSVRKYGYFGLPDGCQQPILVFVGVGGNATAARRMKRHGSSVNAVMIITQEQTDGGTGCRL